MICRFWNRDVAKHITSGILALRHDVAALAGSQFSDLQDFRLHFIHCDNHLFRFTGNFSVCRDLDKPLLLFMHRIECGQHLKNDPRQIFDLHLRNILLPDRALPGAIVVAQTWIFVTDGHFKGLIRVQNGFFTPNFSICSGEIHPSTSLAFSLE